MINFKTWISLMLILSLVGCASLELQYKEGVQRKSIVKDFSIVKHNKIFSKPTYDLHMKISGQIVNSLGSLALGVKYNETSFGLLNTDSKGSFEKTYDSYNLTAEDAGESNAINKLTISISEIMFDEKEIFSEGRELVKMGPLLVNIRIYEISDSTGRRISIKQQNAVPVILKQNGNIRDEIGTDFITLDDQSVAADVVTLNECRLFSERNLRMQQEVDREEKAENEAHRSSKNSRRKRTKS